MWGLRFLVEVSTASMYDAQEAKKADEAKNAEGIKAAKLAEAGVAGDDAVLDATSVSLLSCVSMYLSMPVQVRFFGAIFACNRKSHASIRLLHGHCCPHTRPFTVAVYSFSLCRSCFP